MTCTSSDTVATNTFFYIPIQAINVCIFYYQYYYYTIYLYNQFIPMAEIYYNYNKAES